MKRVVVVLIILLAASRAEAHVGSPDVFFEGDAGPYHLFVTVRVPQVIPGVATIEIRSSAADVDSLSVVPMRLTGPGSELPPADDPATRSPDDPQFFTASLWLMERGSLQVRITVTGARGPATLAVPVPAMALRTLTMDRGLGALLFGLMLLLAASLVSIVAAAVRESALPAGAPLPPRRRVRIATVLAAGLVIGLIVLGNAWWTSSADSYERSTFKQWELRPRVDGCKLSLPVKMDLLADHGHLLHLFLIRLPGLDHLTHLHPERADGGFVQTLPTLPAGHYQLFADIVWPGGFPLTGIAQLDLPDLHCPELTGDDTAWSGAALGGKTTISSQLPDGGSMIWDRPAELRAGVSLALHFHVVDRDGQPASDLEPYMGMAAHAELVRSDMTVFAHVHPDGSVAMPALELTRKPSMDMDAMPGMAHGPISPALAFPFGFPQPGSYRIFVQIKRAGRIETGVFDAPVD